MVNDTCLPHELPAASTGGSEVLTHITERAEDTYTDAVYYTKRVIFQVWLQMLQRLYSATRGPVE